MSREEKQALGTRASLELFLFNTEQSKEIQNSIALVKALEDGVAKLKLDVKNANSKVSKLKDEKKTTESNISTLKEDLARKKRSAKDKDELIATLEEKITNLQLEVEELGTEKAGGWQGVRENLKKEFFGEGIHMYCKTFLVGDPNYDWRTKFGKGMASFMTDLAQKEAEAIAQK